MFFFGLPTVEHFTATLSFLAAACAAMWVVHEKRNLVRVPVILLSSPAIILGGLFLALQILALGCETYSAPLYSPDHTKAVRTTTDDEGALGGHTQLELLTHHGFSSTDVVAGGWRAVEIEDVRWTDDRHLEVKYYADYPEFHCDNTSSVEVHCVPKPPPSNSGKLPSPDALNTAELRTAKDGTFDDYDDVILTGQVGYAIVYVNEANSVVWQETRWKGDHELEIVYRGLPKTCSSAGEITVTCTKEIDHKVGVDTSTPTRRK